MRKRITPFDRAANIYNDFWRQIDRTGGRPGLTQNEQVILKFVIVEGIRKDREYNLRK